MISWLTPRACLRRSVRERRMREIRTSGVTREGVAGLSARPLYSTVNFFQSVDSN